MKPASEYSFFRWNDLILVLGILTVVLVNGTLAGKDDGSCTMLQVSSGSSTQWISLPADTSMQVAGHLGPLDIQVEGSRARMTNAPCPGQDCVRQGWIDRSGEMVVCVPSGVFMVLSDDAGTDGAPDAVTY